MKNNLYILTLINALFYILSSILFHKTKGLLFIWAIQNDKKLLKYVTELYSSGSNDNILIGITSFLYLLLAIVLLYKKQITNSSLVILSIAVSIQFFTITLIDSGSIVETIIYAKNYILLFWIMNYIFSIYLLYKNIFNNKA